MKKVRVNISLSDFTPAKLKTAKNSLTKQGLKVDSVLEAVGIISGEVDKTKVGELDAGEGATVELDETVEIPPPDAHIQ